MKIDYFRARLSAVKRRSIFWPTAKSCLFSLAFAEPALTRIFRKDWLGRIEKGAGLPVANEFNRVAATDGGSDDPGRY